MVAVLQPADKTQGKLILIDRAVVLVGRSSDCDAIIGHSQKISRRHCALVQVDETYYVRDLGSMNGVWLNGERVQRETLMKAGDRLSIGDVEYIFHPNVRIESKKTVADRPPEPSATSDAAKRTVANTVDLPPATAPRDITDDDGAQTDDLEIVEDAVIDDDVDEDSFELNFGDDDDQSDDNLIMFEDD
ncbi:MAG: FHA domain-containing protein [Planctomycetaceae bacterium]|nr:FHA domain-containing protein [Planctomycetaceae bacterium]